MGPIGLHGWTMSLKPRQGRNGRHCGGAPGWHSLRRNGLAADHGEASEIGIHLTSPWPPKTPPSRPLNGRTTPQIDTNETRPRFRDDPVSATFPVRRPRSRSAGFPRFHAVSTQSFSFVCFVYFVVHVANCTAETGPTDSDRGGSNSVRTRPVRQPQTVRPCQSRRSRPPCP